MPPFNASSTPGAPVHDLLFIGGGINGCGIARDVAGRGLSVMLCEKGDLARDAAYLLADTFRAALSQGYAVRERRADIKTAGAATGQDTAGRAARLDGTPSGAAAARRRMNGGERGEQMQLILEGGSIIVEGQSHVGPNDLTPGGSDTPLKGRLQIGLRPECLSRARRDEGLIRRWAG